jgi:hypothetical protein
VPDQSIPFDPTGVVVVGAGAAGLATAIFARRFNPSRPVLLLDGAKRPGAKILVSGGSRCNVTNRVVGERDFWGGRSTMVRRVLKAFTADAAVRFFLEMGVRLREEEDGKLFPDSNRSRDVLHALLREVASTGATLLADHRVVGIAREPDRFRIETAHGRMEAAAVVIATGGQSLPKSGSDGTGYELARRLGHSTVSPTPALVPLVLDERTSIHREVAGVAQDVELTLWIDGGVSTRLTGALLWTHVGASGPVAMNMSRHWLRAREDGRRAIVTLSFCPRASFDQIDARMASGAGESRRVSVQTTLSQLVPASVAGALVARLAIDPKTPLAHLSRADRRRLAHALIEWPLAIVGTRGYNYAEATAGGVTLDEIDPATMESRVCPGLFLVGEVLDVDGRIGGFNFQWAWSSAFVAARALGRRAT